MERLQTQPYEWTYQIGQIIYANLNYICNSAPRELFRVEERDIDSGNEVYRIYRFQDGETYEALSSMIEQASKREIIAKYHECQGELAQKSRRLDVVEMAGFYFDICGDDVLEKFEKVIVILNRPDLKDYWSDIRSILVWFQKNKD